MIEEQSNQPSGSAPEVTAAADMSSLRNERIDISSDTMAEVSKEDLATNPDQEENAVMVEDPVAEIIQEGTQTTPTDEESILPPPSTMLNQELSKDTNDHPTAKGGENTQVA